MMDEVSERDILSCDPCGRSHHRNASHHFGPGCSAGETTACSGCAGTDAPCQRCAGTGLVSGHYECPNCGGKGVQYG